MQSKAATVAAYIDELPADRRAAVETVRETILQSLGKGYEEGMVYGGIGYYIPHRIYPAGYHCDPKLPLTFAGLASQKNHLSLYLGCFDMDHDWFRQAWEKTGKKLDMGKACLRFRKVEDLNLDLIAEAIRRFPVEKFIEIYEAGRQRRGKAAGKTGAPEKAPARKAPDAKKARKAAAR